MKDVDLTPDGPELAEVIIDQDGTVTNVWADGTRGFAGTAPDQLIDRQRARSIATHSLLKRKRRLWPQPRI